MKFFYEPLTAATKDVVEKGLPTPTFLIVVSADHVGRMDKCAQVEFMRGFERTVSEKRPPNLTLFARYIEENEDFLPPLMLKEGLGELFREYRFPANRPVKGLANITAYYAGLSGSWDSRSTFPKRRSPLRRTTLPRRGSAPPRRRCSST